MMSNNLIVRQQRHNHLRHLRLSYPTSTNRSLTELRMSGVLDSDANPRSRSGCCASSILSEIRVIALHLTSRLKEVAFIIRSTGVALTDDGRRQVIRAYERRLDTDIIHPRFGYTASYRRIMEVQARLLAAYVMREIPTYEPFVTR
jgi:hypothetical protein